MKSKNAPQTTRQKILKWIAIRPTMILVVLWLGLKLCMGILRDPTIFYPLRVMMASDWELVLIGLITVIVVVGDGFRLWRWQSVRWGLWSIVIQDAAFIILMMLLMPVSPRLTYLQSLYIDQQIYHLEKNTGDHISTYDVLECDQTGLMCHTYATPYASTLECFKEGAVLAQDPVTKRLLLHIGADIYEVDPANNMRRNPLCYIWSNVFRA